jgi:uncharacterized membrane protein YcfT
MARMGTDVGQGGAARVDWVDYAKGFCIIMVVMMHSTLGVEQARGLDARGRGVCAAVPDA